MKSIFQFICLILALSSSVHYSLAEAAEYPNRTIEMIIPFDPGSGTDVIGRLAAELAQESLGVKIHCTNKPGGAGATGLTFIKNSKPDGYTIGISNSTLVSHKVFDKLPFDHHDVEVVTIFNSIPNLMCVPAASPYNTLDDIIADAKKRPGEISWACATGNMLLISQAFFKESGLKFKVVPSGGGAIQPVIQALGGHVDISYPSVVESKTQIEAGLLRPIVVNAEERLSFIPDIPTFRELGYEKIPAPTIRMIITPSGVDRDKLEILNSAFRKAFATEKFRNFVEGASGVVLDASFEDAMKLLDEREAMFRELVRQD